MASNDFNGRGGHSKLFGQEPEEDLIRPSLHRRRSHSYFNSISIRTYNLIPRRFGLEIYFKKNIFHLSLRCQSPELVNLNLFFNSYKRQLPSCFSFFSIGEEKVSMTPRTEVDPENLFFFDPFFFDLGDVD